MSEFEGQVVIVTGSAGAGVGQATARRFAAEGAEVVVSDLSEKRVLAVGESLAEEHGREYLAIPCDVSDQESVAELIGKTIERYGRIDHLVNNAYRDMETPFLEMDDVTWHTPINVCLHGTYYCTKAAVPHMIEQGGGNIVNFASVVTWRGGQGRAQYAAAKAGIIAFTRVIALELGEHNIRANTVAPSSVWNEWMGRTMGTVPEGSDEHPLNRSAMPDELANVVRFLCSKESEYITGEVISVGGQRP